METRPQEGRPDTAEGRLSDRVALSTLLDCSTARRNELPGHGVADEQARETLGVVAQRLAILRKATPFLLPQLSLAPICSLGWRAGALLEATQGAVNGRSL